MTVLIAADVNRQSSCVQKLMHVASCYFTDLERNRY